MCEFCTKHGEGKKWYLEMKNYTRELLHQELPEETQELAGSPTRREWIDEFFGNFVVPAITGEAPPQKESGRSELSDEERLAARQVVHFGQVIPIEDVEQVFDRAESITRLPCGCRFMSTGKTDKRYCFGLGLMPTALFGMYPEASSSLEVLDKEEAMGAVQEYDEEGLVHSVWTGVSPYVMAICNCDRDCIPYKGYIEKRGVPSFFRAEYVGEVDWDLCSGCKECVSQCQFGAEFYSSALGKVYIDPTRCFGCGVCRAACPNEAISMVPREEREEAAGVYLSG